MIIRGVYAWSICVYILSRITGISADTSEPFKPKLYPIDAKPDKAPPSNSFYVFQDLIRFDDTPNLLFVDADAKVKFSENYGADWKLATGLDSLYDERKDKENNYESFPYLSPDRIYKHSRAYIYPNSEKGYFLYFTDDAGKTWEKWDFSTLIDSQISSYLPSKVQNFEKKSIYFNHVRSSAGNEKHLMVTVSLYDYKHDYYASFECLSIDLGKSWKVLTPIPKSVIQGNAFENACEFGKFSSESNANDDDILCVVSNRQELAKEEEKKVEDEATDKVTGQMFKSSNIGKTWSMIDSLKDVNVLYFEVTDIYVFAYASKDAFNPWSSVDIYVSTDNAQTFKKAVIAGEIRGEFKKGLMSSNYVQVVDDIVILHARLKPDSSDSEDDFFQMPKEKTFISDSTGLTFYSLDHVAHGKGEAIDEAFSSVESVHGLKGTFYLKTNKIEVTQFEENGQNSIYFNSTFLSDKISFDDGYSWSNVKINAVRDELLSNWNAQCDPSTDRSCTFKSYGTPYYIRGRETALTTPGIFAVNGIVTKGNTYLHEDKKEMQTFITRDGGLSFDFCFNFSANIVYGDYGNILVAIPFNAESDGDPNAEIYYSLDQGYSWQEYQLDYAFAPMNVQSVVMDGSGFHFLVEGLQYDNIDDKNSFIKSKSVRFILDFSDVFEGSQCDQDKDLEVWELNNGECIDGVKHSFKRRKQFSKCSIKTLFEDLKDESSVCECTEKDFECAPGFLRDFSSGACELNYQLLAKQTDISCKSPKDKLKLPTRRLKSNNVCKNPSNVNIDMEEYTCGALGISDGDSKIIVYENDRLDGKPLTYQYFGSLKSDSLLIQTSAHSVFYSTDGGVSLKKFDSGGEDIVEVIFNKYNRSTAYMLGAENSLFVTTDSAFEFNQYKSIPTDSIQLRFPLDFHAKDSDQFIYYGGKDCESLRDPNCHAVAYYTKDGGATFEKLLENALHCEYSGSLFSKSVDENLIICEVRKPGDITSSIISSKDYFKNDYKVLFDSAVGFASYSGYTLFAVTTKDDELVAYVTTDGEEIAETKMPKVFESLKQKAFTALGSSNGALFFHLTTNQEKGKEFGALMKSNSNGTSFVNLERAVNRNSAGFIDFEYVSGLEGIIFTNIVSNSERLVDGKDSKKKLRSQITFNDGAEFRYLNAPQKDSQNRKYSCNVNDVAKCSLNLHGFTERTDIRDTFSSGSAVGMMIGVGNVGDELKPFNECGTFMTVDAGVTWKELLSEPYQWEYGDRGSIIVLVKAGKETDSIVYSVDSGKTWKNFKFSSTPVTVLDIVTHPVDASMKFFLLVQNTNSNVPTTVALDFSEVFERQCHFDFADSKTDDYDYFPLRHPESKCLFGHEVEYLKKIRDDCYIGMAPLKQANRITSNCSCTRDDFECDYNFYRSDDGTCKLVEGLSPLDPLEVCAKDEKLVEFFMPTGYRKIPLSTCQGGKQLDKSSSAPKACPGKEKEYKALHSMGFMSKFFIFVIPFCVMLFATWFVYDRGIRRNGGFSRFGEIRLNDEDDLVEDTLSDAIVNRIVMLGVASFHGLSSLWFYAKKPLVSLKNKVTGFTGISRISQNGPRYSSLIQDQFMNDADDLLSGHDEDADDLATLNSSDINFDINDVANTSEEDTNFAPYSDGEHEGDQEEEEEDDEDERNR